MAPKKDILPEVTPQKKRAKGKQNPVDSPGDSAEEKKVWNALMYTPKNEDKEQKQWREGQLEAWRTASQEDRAKLVSAFVASGRKIKKWYTVSRQSVSETSTCTTGAVDDWMDEDQIMSLWNLSYQDPKREEKMKLITEGKEVRDHRDPAFAKAGYKEWKLYKEKMRETGHVVSNTTEVASEGEIGYLARGLGTTAKEPEEVGTPKVALEVDEEKVAFTKCVKEALTLERAVQAEMVRVRELERDVEIVADESLFNLLTTAKDHAVAVLAKFDTELMAAKRFATEYDKEKAPNQTSALMTVMAELNEAFTAVTYKKKQVQRWVTKKQKTGHC
jgi:hypothetical protein